MIKKYISILVHFVILPYQQNTGYKFWSGKKTCSLLIKSCILWSGVLERSLGVEVDLGVTKVERSTSMVCVRVCMAKFYTHTHTHARTHARTHTHTHTHTHTLFYFCNSKIWLHSNTPFQNSAQRLHSIEYMATYFRVFIGGTSTKQILMCLAQGHNATPPMRFELASPRSRVRHSLSLSFVNQYKILFCW